MRNNCCEQNVQLIKEIYGWHSVCGSESLGIYRCAVCGQLWMIRFQFSDGTGRDNIWLKPGENCRGYTFTEGEAAAFQTMP
ncbi:hypothetical protein CEB3_c13640 [Peptococcaceae bacterium CEB3]|nr:hypothetical protein CEB3_c13640 [Peptococcaceae bacterium CEB3]